MTFLRHCPLCFWKQHLSLAWNSSSKLVSPPVSASSAQDYRFVPLCPAIFTWALGFKLRPTSLRSKLADWIAFWVYYCWVKQSPKGMYFVRHLMEGNFPRYPFDYHMPLNIIKEKGGCLWSRYPGSKSPWGFSTFSWYPKTLKVRASLITMNVHCHWVN